MNITQNIKDVLLPLKVMWIALTLSVIVQNIVYLFAMGSVNFEFEAVYPYSLFYIFLISSMVFVTLFKSRFHSFIKAVDPKKAPFTKKLSESEQEILKYFPKYFVYHLLVWAINDGLVIVAFVVSYLTKNYSYLFISSLFAITFNLLKAKPNYLKFCRDKTYYGK